MSIKQFIREGIKAYHVWPVAFMAFLIGPGLAVYQSLHQINGPDVRILKNFETQEAYDKKKFKYFTTIDHENYEHPRPRF
ncbi:NADH dehydrogenase [ubiquinone] 1 alpha subcomplex subunit 4-like protein [Sarcoptes scabiei]|uniref:NADH dehydrogenase [ubiquinone] 1 alpha subcomplex subunit 4-like protein n=1 Tax=Sarcoptes scabiei TaxID=52283 RepID=A0A131ZUK9_SARSC|nr:NADH dehydrogenase [ubiquinone] 1 alpha subcomplex subunit 4-like protein [Sarcoptes scabiei]